MRDEEEEAGHGDDNAGQSMDGQSSSTAGAPSTTAAASSTVLSGSLDATEAAVADLSLSSDSTAEEAPQQVQTTLGVQSPLESSSQQQQSPPARTASHIHQLADDELRSAIQFLDTDSRLKAARCSRRLMQAADHPFAWSGAKDFIIDSREHAQLGTRIS